MKNVLKTKKYCLRNYHKLKIYSILITVSHTIFPSALCRLFFHLITDTVLIYKSVHFRIFRLNISEKQLLLSLERQITMYLKTYADIKLQQLLHFHGVLRDLFKITSIVFLDLHMLFRTRFRKRFPLTATTSHSVY